MILFSYVTSISSDLLVGDIVEINTFFDAVIAEGGVDEYRIFFGCASMLIKNWIYKSIGF